ncbi:MAG: YggT family protein [Cyanobacteria bacterium J06621_11]
MAATIIAPVMEGLVTFLQLYSFLLIVRILLSWFPNIDWSNPFFSTISQLTDPYLNLFRSIIPPIGGLDLSAILAIIALNFLTAGVERAAIAAVVAAQTYAMY